MKKLLLVIPVILLTACSSAKVAGFKDVEYIQRQEVIFSAKECVNARMKPNIKYVRQQTAHGIVMLPVLVTCEPAYNSK